MLSVLNKNKAKYAFVIFIILYAVGFWGFYNKDQFIIMLTPINLMISLALLIWCYPGQIGSWIGLTLFIYVGGFIIEAIGVNTGWPFGAYTYYETFGWKWLQTPLLIGVNWVILVHASRALSTQIWKNKPDYLKIITAALLMTALDILIEPVAIQYRFWEWDAAEIPLANYISWFTISLIFQLVSFKLISEYKEPFTASVFIIQVLFFLNLNLFAL